MRIFIDCTHTHAKCLNTGIERVVRNIANHCGASGALLGMTCQPVILHDDRYIPVATIQHDRAKQRRFAVRAALNTGYSALVRQVARLLPATWQRFVTGTTHEVSLARAILLLLTPVSSSWSMARRLLAASAAAPLPVEFGKGDMLLLADGVWNYAPWAGVRAARGSGARVVAMVYDIIPVTHAQFFAPHISERFSAALQLLFEHADGFVCISAYTESQLRSFYAAQPYARQLSQKTFGTFTLGAELDALDPRGEVRAKMRSVFERGSPVYLVVGTLEPRKNHGYLLQVFRKLWDEGSNAALLIVGRVGWMCEEIVEATRDHPKAGRQLFLMDDVTDTELDYCYAHARALLFPAIVEGFGLPIVESLRKGLPVFASDIPVFHEVGGAHVAYFDCTEPDSLVGLLRAYEATGTCPARPPSEFNWPNWSESTAELLTSLSFMRHGGPALPSSS